MTDTISAQREALIPADAVKVEYRDANAVVYLFTGAAGYPAYKLFIGRRAKATDFYRFRTPDKRDQYIADRIKKLADAIEARRKRKEEAKSAVADHQFKTGLILCSTWGYNMTFCDFYVVLAVTKSTLVVREIKSEIVTGDGFSGTAKASEPIEMEGEPFRLRIKGKNYASYDGKYFSIWDGTPKYYNHLD